MLVQYVRKRILKKNYMIFIWWIANSCLKKFDATLFTIKREITKKKIKNRYLGHPYHIYRIYRLPPQLFPFREFFRCCYKHFWEKSSKAWKGEMDPLFLAYSYYRRKKYEQCTEICSQLLEKNPYDQVKLVFLILHVIFINWYIYLHFQLFSLSLW